MAEKQLLELLNCSGVSRNTPEIATVINEYFTNDVTDCSDSETDSDSPIDSVESDTNNSDDEFMTEPNGIKNINLCEANSATGKIDDMKSKFKCKCDCLSKFELSDIVSYQYSCQEIDFYDEQHYNMLNERIVSYFNYCTNVSKTTMSTKQLNSERKKSKTTFLFQGQSICRVFFFFYVYTWNWQT